MANFNTHLIVASTATGLAATGCLGAGIATPKEVLLYFFSGTLGGLLPDIDSDNSMVLKILFASLAVFAAFLAMFSQVNRYSIAELTVIWIIIFILIYYLVSGLFKRFTVHRGLFHSIPAALLFWFLGSASTFRFLQFSEVTAWMSGSFIFLGYLTHLVLDEIYSVDLANQKIKRSFGTAIKLIDRKNISATVVLYLLVIGAFLLAPNSSTFARTLLNQQTYARFKQQLLPKERWFQDLEQPPAE